MAIQTIAGSIRKTERYNPDQIEQIKQSLQQLIDAGKPRYYEIKVDGLQMVAKTTDLSRFDSYEQNVTEDTEEIKFLLYQGNSHKYDLFTHTFKEDHTLLPVHIPQPSALNATPEIVEDKVKQALRERDVMDYKKRIAQLEEELEENKDYVVALETQVEDLQKKLEYLSLAESTKNRNQEIILSLISKGNDFIKRNPHVLNGIPFLGETLAVDLQKQQQEEAMRFQYEQMLLKQNTQKDPSPEPNATFSEKE